MIADTINTTFSLPKETINNLNEGFHNLYVRVKDLEDNWSLLYEKQFYKIEGKEGWITIIGAEYFIDDDPDFGEGIEIEVSNLEDTLVTAFEIPVNTINNLEEGFHNLYVRVKDLEGNWSLLYEKQFYKIEGKEGLIEIEAAEYFINDDPGFGKGADIMLQNLNDTLNTNFVIPIETINSLNEGFHNLYVRVKDTESNWSLLYEKQFYIVSGISNEFLEIDVAEYFINEDPGFGNGNRIEIFPSKILDQDFIIPADQFNPLSEGLHTLYLRVKDNEGDWSMINALVKFKPDYTKKADDLYAAYDFI